MDGRAVSDNRAAARTGRDDEKNKATAGEQIQHIPERGEAEGPASSFVRLLCRLGLVHD